MDIKELKILDIRNGNARNGSSSSMKMSSAPVAVPRADPRCVEKVNSPQHCSKSYGERHLDVPGQPKGFRRRHNSCKSIAALIVSRSMLYGMVLIIFIIITRLLHYRIIIILIYVYCAAEWVFHIIQVQYQIIKLCGIFVIISVYFMLLCNVVQKSNWGPELKISTSYHLSCQLQTCNYVYIGTVK